MSKQDKPRCVDCGARDVPLDDEGLCRVCFVMQGLRATAAQLDKERDASKWN